MLSVVIPALNEPYLQKTIDNVLENATGEIEIIVVLDGYKTELKEDPRVKVIQHETPQGMRRAINAGVALAKGDFIMKLDAHCKVGKGFDEILKADCEKDWIVIPRRHRLNVKTWEIDNGGKIPIDYEYLSSDLHGRKWEKRATERKDILIDDNPSFQGSCWFMHRDYFYFLELMDVLNYGEFASEAQELGFKCWLSGGAVKINKKTHYAHWHKDKRGWFLSKEQSVKATTYAEKWKTEKIWHKQTLPFSFFKEKFPTMP